MTPLRQRMMDDMVIRNLADNTQSSYLLQVSSFATHFRRSPEALGPEEIRAWLVYLCEERKLAPTSLHPAVGALRFLYRVTLKSPVCIRIDCGQLGAPSRKLQKPFL